MIKKCRYCKREFISSRKHKYYCSEECYKNNRMKWKKKYNREWCKNNPDKVKKSAQKYRQSKKGKERNERYYREHRKEIRKRTNLWVQKRRLKLINILGNKCQNCGYNKYNEALQFHHINPEEKESGDDWKRKSFDISKVVLLCANCHIEEHIRLKDQND